MLPDSIKTLISDEQARQNGQFINIGLDTYFEKIEEKAEFVADFIKGRCRGFVAYYCNDKKTKTAFITLVLVNPLDRGLGLGQALTDFVLNIAKSRGFAKCRLEVKKTNSAAYYIYKTLGFCTIEDRNEMYLMEVIFEP